MRAYDDGMRRLLLVSLVLLLAGTPSALALPKLRVTVTGQDHHPLVGKRWHYEVRVRNAAGKPVAARIHLQFLFAGVAVGEVGVHKVRNGFWQETFGTKASPGFPPAARGQRLTLQASVTAKGYAPAKAGWWLVVK